MNKGPLEVAKKQVRALLLADRISVRLGNGLETIKPLEVETVTIAGMGGTTIKDILERSPEVVKGLQRLVLQPNVASLAIRVWALNNGWHILDEELVYEDERFYEIIVLEPGPMEIEDEILFLLGPKLVEKFHIHLVPYLKNQWKAEQELLAKLEKVNTQETKEKAQEIRDKWDKIRRVISCRLDAEI